MTRAEYNKLYDAEDEPEDLADDKDLRCTLCYLGQTHCWLEHDRSIGEWEREG